MNEVIKKFLETQTNLTICTAVENIPYCANCFFVWDNKFQTLVFKSDAETRHIEEAIRNNNIAGTIVPDKLEMGKIRGIQFLGTFETPMGEDLNYNKEVYYSKYPFARIMPGNIWKIKLNEIKMTDNTLGFGKKLKWNREEMNQPG